MCEHMYVMTDRQRASLALKVFTFSKQFAAMYHVKILLVDMIDNRTQKKEGKKQKRGVLLITWVLNSTTESTEGIQETGPGKCWIQLFAIRASIKLNTALPIYIYIYDIINITE